MVLGHTAYLRGSLKTGQSEEWFIGLKDVQYSWTITLDTILRVKMSCTNQFLNNAFYLWKENLNSDEQQFQK